MSAEFFYLDADGGKSDAAPHDDILDNPEADSSTAIVTAKKAVVGGMDEFALMDVNYLSTSG